MRFWLELLYKQEREDRTNLSVALVKPLKCCLFVCFLYILKYFFGLNLSNLQFNTHNYNSLECCNMQQCLPLALASFIFSMSSILRGMYDCRWNKQLIACDYMWSNNGTSPV